MQQGSYGGPRYINIILNLCHWHPGAFSEGKNPRNPLSSHSIRSSFRLVKDLRLTSDVSATYGGNLLYTPED